MEGKLISIEPVEGREQVNINVKCRGMRARLTDATKAHSVCEQTEISRKNEMYQAREILFLVLIFCIL